MKFTEQEIPNNLAIICRENFKASSNVNEGSFKLFIFLTERLHMHKKHKRHKDAQAKAQKRK